MIEVLVLSLGLLIGSFLNVCIYRIPREESISFPPSHCTSCGNRIKWYDLLPVISYVILRGKCRNCKERISLRYPILELITGILYLGLYLKYGLSFSFFKYIIIVTFLIVIGIIDYETTDVYLKTTLPGIIIGIILVFVGNYLGSGIMEYVYGGLLGGGVILLIILLTHGMGLGDAEICFLCGIFLGFRLTAVMLFLSFVIGGVAGGALLLLKIKSRKDYIPFGPFIAAAAIITIFIGEGLINWYLSLL